MQSCSTQDEALRKEEYTKTRDYTSKKIDYLELKKINNQVFIETAKLTKIATASNNVAKGINSNYDLDLQNIQYIKRDNNDETFSFRIFQIPNSTIQQNIVVECKENKNPQTYLITYYLNKKINQINNSNDFIQAIKSTSIIKINNILTTTKTASSSGCLQIGYYDDVEVCQNNLDTRPRCYESDGTTPAKIKVFKVIDSACSTGGGPTDFIPLASQWQYSHPVSTDPNPDNTGVNSGGGYTGNGTPGGDESNSLNIYAANYFTGGDLNDPAVQNKLRINQFITSLYNSSNEIKGVIDNTEWLLAYTNYWIGTNGGLTTSNQNALTYAFNNIPTLFYQHYSNNYTPVQVMNFQISVFQFSLYHGEFLSKLDPLTQKSILDEITSLGQIELINNVVNFMIENTGATWENTRNIFVPQTIVKAIDVSSLDPCPKGVFTTVKNTTICDISQVLAKLDANKSVYNTIIKSEVPSNGNPATTFPTSRFNYTIQISTDYAGKTKLFIANSLIHELVHAYFLSIVDDYKSNPNNNQNLYNLNSFPSLFQAYCDKKYPPTPSVSQNLHHLEMANYYVDAIARALQEFQTGIPVTEGTSPQQIFSDLAWGGLNGTPVFDATYPAGNPNRQRILNRAACEQNGTTIGAGTPNAQTPIGKPCN